MSRLRTGILWLIAAVFVAGCAGSTVRAQPVEAPAASPQLQQPEAATPSSPPEGAEVMRLASNAFEHEGMIPAKYTCDGEDVSPALAWEDAPPGTTSFVLIADDPDAPGRTWVHWVLVGLPAEAQQLPEGIPSLETLENGAVHGSNSWGKLGYGGPCPPSGTHRYFFKLYALDTQLVLDPGASKADVLQAMEGHVLAEAELMGKYARR